MDRGGESLHPKTLVLEPKRIMILKAQVRVAKYKGITIITVFGRNTMGCIVFFTM